MRLSPSLCMCKRVSSLNTTCERRPTRWSLTERQLGAFTMNTHRISELCTSVVEETYAQMLREEGGLPPTSKPLSYIAREATALRGLRYAAIGPSSIDEKPQSQARYLWTQHYPNSAACRCSQCWAELLLEARVLLRRRENERRQADKVRPSPRTLRRKDDPLF